MLEHRPQAGADHRLVVDHHDPDHGHAARAGSQRRSASRRAGWCRCAGGRRRPPPAPACRPTRCRRAGGPTAGRSCRRRRLSTTTPSASQRSVTTARRAAAWRMALVSASCAMRTAASSTWGSRSGSGSGRRSSMSRPASPTRGPAWTGGRSTASVRGASAGGVAVAPEHPHRAPHGGERLLRRLGDPPERSRGDLGPGRPHPVGGLRPDDDGGQVVGDDVVQLAGDAGALLGDDLLGLDPSQPPLLTHERPQERGARHHEQREQHPRPVEAASQRQVVEVAEQQPRACQAHGAHHQRADGTRLRDQVSDGEDGQQVELGGMGEHASTGCTGWTQVVQRQAQHPDVERHHSSRAAGGTMRRSVSTAAVAHIATWFGPNGSASLSPSPTGVAAPR